MTQMTSMATMPHRISLFFMRADLIKFTKRLDLTMSFYMPNKFFIVLFSSLSVCDLRLNFMSLAMSSHSRPTCLASSSLFLSRSKTRSCLDPISMSSPVSYRQYTILIKFSRRFSTTYHVVDAASEVFALSFSLELPNFLSQLVKVWLVFLHLFTEIV